MKRTAILVILLAVTLVAFGPVDKNKEKKDIKISLEADVLRGEAPLPVNFVAEVIADEELKQYIYESSSEWKIEGSFVLTDPVRGGNPADRDMRTSSMSGSERFLYTNKHLVARSRKRAPRKKFSEKMEVPFTFDYAHTFEKPGKYYITFRMRNGKYSSRQLTIDVRGDTSFDPIRDRH